MSETQDSRTRVFTFTKIFAWALILYSIIPFVTILLRIVFSKFIENTVGSTGLTMIPLEEIVLDNGVILFYTFVGGVGLLKKRLWALYFVTIFGIYHFILTVIEFVFSLQYVGSYDSPKKLILMTALGLGSMYLFRNRLFFKSQVSKT